MEAPTRFIAPKILARIAGLELLARGVVEGFVAGLHKSPYKGFSVDFMEYRPYNPGDDLMRVDWKLFARTDRYYVKEYEGETNARMHIVLDTSASMGYASHEVTKLDYACFVAASLAYLGVRQHDSVGLTLFDTTVHTTLPPRAGKSHLITLLSQLQRAQATDSTKLGRPLHQVAERSPRRSFVVLISDLLSDLDPLVDALKHFRFLGHEVLVFHILDPREVDFDFSDVIELQDSETDERLVIDAESARDTYRTNFQAYTERLRKSCGLLNVDRAMLLTTEPLDKALFQYLRSRSIRFL